MGRILLISMPFGSLNRPALGISLLKARLSDLSIACDIKYFGITFAELIGCDEYQWISSEIAYTAYAGDWTFTEALYGNNVESDQRYMQDILRTTWQLDDYSINRLWRIRSLVPYFLQHCMDIIPWDNYSVVGFTSTFEQNIASLALAKAIKQAHPQIAIVFGGANWEGDMGFELHKQFKFVDYACSGEAENSFPALVQLILGRRASNKSIDEIRGIIYRSAGATIYTGDAELILDLDELPIPDFSDYFHDLSQSTVIASVIPVLLFETSRGCWWGQKSHCTFCGLNGKNLTFRSKSCTRALEELFYLVDQWHISLIEVVDNMLDMGYFKDFLPTLAKTEKSFSLFYEVKANLTRSQVKTLREANVDRIQPGIESLNNHVLSLMRKGTTGLRNLQLLKWCKEYNIQADWNILYGFPGETIKDYESMIKILPSIRFLCSPPTCGPIRMDRFSPFYNQAPEFGLTNVRPIKSYQYIYPFDRKSLLKIAYCFDFDYKPEVDPTGCASQLTSYIEAWRQDPEKGTLTSITRPDGTLALIDTRSNAKQSEYILPELERDAYEYCDSMRTASSVTNHLSQRYAQIKIEYQQVVKYLNSLVANNLMVTDGTHYLSLAISSNSMTDEI